MFLLPILLASRSAISSPASASGRMRYAGRGGLMTARSGQAPAPASLSARQAKALGLLTSGTYGPRSSISFASADLASSLANRLRAKTDSLGSTLYTLTWKERATPSGRSIPALRASGRRTSDKECTGLVTPSARDWKDTAGMSTIGVNPDGSGRSRVDQLPRQAVLSGWPTPIVNDELGSTHCYGPKKEGEERKRFLKLPGAANLAGWPTPRAVDGEKNSRTMEGAMREMERENFAACRE